MVIIEYSFASFCFLKTILIRLLSGNFERSWTWSLGVYNFNFLSIFSLVSAWTASLEQDVIIWRLYCKYVGINLNWSIKWTDSVSDRVRAQRPLCNSPTQTALEWSPLLAALIFLIAPTDSRTDTGPCSVDSYEGARSQCCICFSASTVWLRLL